MSLLQTFLVIRDLVSIVPNPVPELSRSALSWVRLAGDVKAGCDWAGWNWAGCDWAGRNWAGCDWAGWNWADCDWAGCDWAGWNWADWRSVSRTLTGTRL